LNTKKCADAPFLSNKGCNKSRLVNPLNLY
jgi:hypothetical protein